MRGKRENKPIGKAPTIEKVALSLWDMTNKKKYLTGFTVYGNPEAVRIAIETHLTKLFGSK